ncbi:MAG: peptidase T [Bacteroidetes bacterium]|nr:peptidase T [Bacteroidota bacterium]
MPKLNINYTCSERFLKYVTVDTQSDMNSTSSPSTEKQKNLGKILVEELLAMGIKDAHLDDFGYVYATLPSNTDKRVPVICFCSHMDTSPESSGANVKPVVHKNYGGGDITLLGDASQIIKPEENPELNKNLGCDIITSDGTTLLGADNKAGLAEIMDAMNFFVSNPAIKHGTIKILFTPDEEIGRGVDNVDLKKLGADFGYTVDGEAAGNIENETFSADAVTIVIHGFNAHPGFAKGVMENAVKIASEIISSLPKETCSPETTANKEGFVHPIVMTGGVESMTLKFIVRDFSVEGLKEKEKMLETIAENVLAKYKRSSYKFEVTEQYRNMKEILDKNPKIVEYAVEAVKRAGLTPNVTSIRGGTDGSRLSFMGLPCPNIFAGEHAFHSKLEWTSVQEMQKAVDTIIHLAMIWEEKA